MKTTVASAQDLHNLKILSTQSLTVIMERYKNHYSCKFTNFPEINLRIVSPTSNYINIDIPSVYYQVLKT